jgi:hypothetical protein
MCLKVEDVARDQANLHNEELENEKRGDRNRHKVGLQEGFL